LLKHAEKTQNPTVTDRFFTFSLYYDGSDTNYVDKGQVVSFCGGSEVCRGLGARSKGPFSNSRTSLNTVVNVNVIVIVIVIVFFCKNLND
jgi:hypothetical protein